MRRRFQAGGDATAATPDDVREAIQAGQGQEDPDVIPAGSQQATTTQEAREEAKKILGRIGTHETEADQLKKDIEANAQASRQALVRAQQFLSQNYWATQPSEQEMTQRAMAAWMRPTTGGVYGANIAQGANLTEELANEAAQRRAAMAGYLEMLSGRPLSQQLYGISKEEQAAREKLLDMQEKYESQLGRSAMTALGRSLALPRSATDPSLKPQSPEGKQAFDELGGYAYNTLGDVTSGLSPAFQARTKQLVALTNAEKKARAGIDDNPLSPDELYESAQVAGVPAVAAPFGLPDPNRMTAQRRKQYYAAEQTAATKMFDQFGAEDSQLVKAMRNMDQFQELNSGHYTGPKIAPITIGGVHAGPHGAGAELGKEGGINVWPPSIIAHWGSAVQEMDKLANDTVPLIVPAKGFGRVTNRDLGLFQSAMFGTDKNKDANDSIITGLRIMVQNSIDLHNFEQAYFGVHQSLKGAPAAWMDYLNHNDIFDHSKPTLANGLKPLNKNRVGWAEYFKSKNLAEHGPKAGTEEVETEAQPGAEPALTPQQRETLRSRGVDINDPTLRGLTPEQMIGATTPAQAEGGSVHMAEGGTPPATPSEPGILDAVANGLTMRALGRQEDPESPGMNWLGEAAGAGATTAAALAALRRPAMAARFIAEHPSLTASGFGALTGGFAGAEGEEGFLPGAASGAIMAPAIGLMARRAPLVGTNALYNLSSRLRGLPLTPGLEKSVGALEHDVGGDMADVGRRFQQDRRLGVPATLAESAGPRSTGLASAALGRDVPQTNVLLNALQERQAGAPERVSQWTAEGLKPDEYEAKTEQLREALYTNAKPLYDQAYAQFPSLKSPALLSILDNPYGQEASIEATKMMQAKGLPIGPVGATGMAQTFSLQYLDEVKRALDDMIKGAEGTGANYSSSNKGKALREMRSRLVNELDTSTLGPEGQPSPYRAARDQFSGDLEVRDALRDGRAMFPSLTPEQLRQLMGKLDYSARDAYRSGVAEGIFQRIGNMTSDANSAQRVIASQNLRDKVRAIFDSDADADRFLDRLSREAAIFKSGRSMISAGQEGLAQSHVPQSLWSRVKARATMPPGTAGDIAETMGTMANDPQAGEKLARLRQAADRLRTRSSLGSILGAGAGVGSNLAMTPTLLDRQTGQPQ